MFSVAITVSGAVSIILLTSLVQAKTVTFDCDTVGKKDSTKYIECLTQQQAATNSYFSLQCPPSTCLDPASQTCSSKACNEQGLPTTPSPPSPIPSDNINVWLKPDDATESEEIILNSLNEQPLSGIRTSSHVHTKRTTPAPKNINVWVEPEKNLTAEYIDPRTTNYDFTSDLDNKRDGRSHQNQDAVLIQEEPLWTPTLNYYNCTARRYNCTGPGLFADEKDNTIFYRCRWSERKNKYRAVCFSCNERFIKCWSKQRKACIPCDFVESNKDFETEVISQDTSYDCVGYAVFPCSRLGLGLHEHPGDKSIAVLCSNQTFQVGEWIGGCITCNRNKLACFIEGIGQCVDNCTGGDVFPYDCSHYKVDKSVPCKEKGKFPTPLDSTTYFQCVEAEDGSGRFYPECQPCRRKWFFDPYRLECVGEEDEEDDKPQMDARGYFEELDHDSITPDEEPPPVPERGYDCKFYKDFMFPCRYSGYFSHPEDTSVYFSCWALPSGGFVSACYTCNKLFKTCFDDLQKACVTVGKNETCSTSSDIQNRTDKGTPGFSRTWSCDGYTEGSFPCKSYSEGYFAMPGDTSVYVHCEDKNGDMIPEYESCHTCNKETDGCWNSNLSKCVNYCAGKPGENLTVKAKPEMPRPEPLAQRKLVKLMQAETRSPYPWTSMYHPPYILSLPKLSYDCLRVSYACVRTGVFVNTLDPSVWFECSRGRRYNDWSVKCRVCPRFTCFDVRFRRCVPSCRRISESWKFHMCRDNWTPTCELLGIG